MKKIAILSCLAALALIMLPTTMILLVGGLPAIVALFIDKTRNNSLAISVLLLNLAATVTYLMQLWLGGNSVASALQIISDPTNVIVIYSGALAGYGVHAVLGGLEAEIMYGRAKKRKSDVKKSQVKLIDRWGEEVTKPAIITSKYERE